MRIGEMVSTMQKMVDAMNNFNALAQKSAQRIATGKRINSATDDPSAIAQINRMDSSIRAHNIYQKNLENGISLVKTMDSALSSISNIGQKLSELAVQYNNSALSNDEKTQIEEQAKAYLDEIKSIMQNTEFNGIKVFQNPSYNIYAGAGSLSIDTPKFNITDGSTTGTYTITDNNGTVTSDKTASEILTSDFVNQNIVNPVSQARSNIGIKQTIMENRLDFEKNLNAIQTEALSRVEDVDLAEENLQMTKYQTLAAVNGKLLSTYSYQMTAMLGQMLDVRV